MKQPKNVPASIRQRLLNKSRSEHRPFNELLQYYAMERFLYRLSKSAHADSFILKGALMLRVWNSPKIRPTMDIDLLGKTNSNESNIIEQIRDILSIDVEPDGIVFNPASIQSERITEDADYEGIRIIFLGELYSAEIHMQIDIGFGDIVFPEPELLIIPTLLDLPSPKLHCYSMESTISEKFEAMVKLSTMNSRMKDFYDIWLLSHQFDFEGARLAEAIRLTFNHRGTELNSQIDAFTDTFIISKQVQWTVFRKKLEQDNVPESFGEIVKAMKEFLSPMVTALSSNTEISSKWFAPGRWI
jgi:hypothetical protein